jgi:hypothetical protein
MIAVTRFGLLDWFKRNQPGISGFTPPLCVCTQLSQDDADQPKKANDLNGKESETDRCHGVCLDEAHMD